MAAPLPHHVQAAMTPHRLRENEKSPERVLQRIPFANQLIQLGHSFASIPQFSAPPIWERNVDNLHPYFEKVDALMTPGSIAFSIRGKEMFLFLNFKSPDDEQVRRIYHIPEDDTASEIDYYQVSKKDTPIERQLNLELGKQQRNQILAIMKQIIPTHKKSSWTSSLKLGGILGALVVAYFANRFFATQE